MYEGAMESRQGTALGRNMGSSAQVNTPIGGVPSSVGALDHVVDHQRSLIESLAQRLEMAGVLRPSVPTPTGADKRASEMNGSCGLSHQLNTYRDRIVASSAVITDLVERLDI